MPVHLVGRHHVSFGAQLVGTFKGVAWGGAHGVGGVGSPENDAGIAPEHEVNW